MVDRIISDIPDYNGPGVYALVDSNGRSYIGSSKHIRKRILEHDSSMRKSILEKGNWTVNKEIYQAITSGIKFRTVILHKFENGCTLYEMIRMEGKFLSELGGVNNTYNGTPMFYVAKDSKIGMRRCDPAGKEELKQVQLDMQRTQYEVVQAHAQAQGESVNGFIKRAIRETMERDKEGRSCE